jgi:hypothetical protein
MRRAWVAGIAGPVGFVLVGFTMAALRPDLIRVEGWASWPSSMALGGPPAAIPQILAFLWLGGCYAVFAVRALRPTLHSPVTTGGFLAIAGFDVLLAFPTDAAGAGVTWHGSLHLVGVLGATAATLVAAGASVLATRDRPEWRPWRFAAGVLFLAALLGLVAGFDLAWAKVVYVLGITLPVTVLAWCVRGELERSSRR